MSGAVGLDLRIPIGGLFTILGAILVAYGLLTAGDAAHYAASAGLNINLWWGLAMTVFGLACLALARRATRHGGARPAAETPEGRATEAREHELGLEREERTPRP